MLHKDIASRGVTGTWRLTEHLLELVAMPGYGTVDGDNIGRSIALISRFIDAHRLGKLRPGRAVHVGVVMPVAQIAHTWRTRGPRRVDGRARSHMLDDRIIPAVSVLVAKNQDVSRHGSRGIWFLKVIGKLSGFAGRGLGEVDVVDVRPRVRRRGRRGHRGGGRWR